MQSWFAARQSGAMTPIVGRKREIELMSERWSLARSGQGQMVVVSGEAGIGKSRITQAVIDEIGREDRTRMSYQCSPYHADSAFYPVIQQMSFAAGIAPSDSSDVRLDKLEALLGADQDTLRLVAPLLGLDGVPRYGALDLTPTQQRARTMQALSGEAYALSDLHRLQAAKAVAGGDTEAAERCLVTGLDVARRQGSKLWELRVAIDLAHLWQEHGRVDEAVALLDPVHSNIAEGDCPEDCAIAQAMLNALRVE